MTTPTATDLRAERLAAGLSQARCAKLLGVATTTIERWEAGHRGMPGHVVWALRWRLQPAGPDGPSSANPKGRVGQNSENLAPATEVGGCSSPPG